VSNIEFLDFEDKHNNGSVCDSSETREFNAQSRNTSFCSDVSRMPPTREQSPEPAWNLADFNQTLWNDFARSWNSKMPRTRERSSDRKWNSAKSNQSGLNDVAPAYDEACRHSHQPKPAALTPEQSPRTKSSPKWLNTATTSVSSPQPTLKEKADASSKSRCKKRESAVSDWLYEDSKDELAKTIFDMMIKKGLTSPQGYMLLDVLSEVWSDLGINFAEGTSQQYIGQVAQSRFCALLSCATQYFEVYSKDIPIARYDKKNKKTFRKSEKMVRLVHRVVD